MEIFINKQKIDFKLENETVLHEVVDGLTNWAEHDGYHFQDIVFDSILYSPDSRENRNVSVDSVSKLEITAKNLFELYQENLQLLYQYISLFIKSLESRNEKLIRDLQNEAPYITSLISELLDEKKDSRDSTGMSLLKNIESIDPENFRIEDEKVNYLLRQLSDLKIILNERISEIGDPFGELSKAVTALKLIQNELNDISVLLQTGQDRAALGSIIKFSELNQKTLRLYPILKNENFINIDDLTIDEMSFSDFYLDFNGILNELLEAFTANDSVLIGDLLEYEISPRLGNLINTLDGIIEENRK